MPTDNTVGKEVPPATGIAAEAPVPRKLWHAGSLTYTAGGLAVLFFWLLWGDFAFSLKERSVPQTLQLLLQKFEARDVAVGFLIGSLPQAISIFLSPVISYWSDRHRGRWGRRIPFLFVPTPLAFLSMVGLAYSPVIGRWLHPAVVSLAAAPVVGPWLHYLLGNGALRENVSVIICFGFFWTLFEISSITCVSVLSGLINDVVPRELLGRFFGLFRIFSLGAGMAFNYSLMKDIEKGPYVGVFLGIGFLYLVSFSAMCLRVKEGTYPPPPPRAAGARGPLWRRFLAAVRIYVRECFSHPYYRWFFLSIALANMAFQPINLFYVLYAKSIGMETGTMGKFFTLQLFLSLLQAYPLGWLADRFHPIRVTIAALVLYVIVTLLTFLFVRGVTPLGYAQVICGTIAGCWMTATAPLGPMLLPRAKFATFASAMGVVASLGLIVVSLVCGRLLDGMNHDYRYIYLWASLFTTLSLLATLVVYRKFQALGGSRSYVAPE
jgi:MFS family permease